MQLELTVNLDNAAFEENSYFFELNRITREVLDKISLGDTEGHCFDSNGNRCGDWSIGE